jgi:hypothetical protein
MNGCIVDLNLAVIGTLKNINKLRRGRIYTKSFSNAIECGSLILEGYN